GGTSVTVGNTLQLSVAVKPDNAANKAVTWSISSGSSYASIDQNGLLTAKKAGSVTVKVAAKDGSGKSATYKITVKAASTALWDGSGTKSDPFLIRNLNDLKNLQKVVNKKGYYFKQVADIDCAPAGDWIVIGDWDNPFRHHIDGGNYTISNLCLDGEAQSLFSIVEDSTFKNMKIVNAYTKDNHRTESNRTDKQPGGGESTGAIVGYGTGCSFDNCSATVNFQSSNSCTGGLIGAVTLKNAKYTLMNNCHVSGTITSGGHAGGLIGNISDEMSDGDYQPAHTITIKNCSADVNIKIFTTSIEAPCAGGLIGESFGVRVEKCHTTGKIDVIEGDIGGLIGNAGNYTDVTRCYSKVDIYASSDDHYGGVSAGGLIGHIYSRSDVYDCYATGNISAPYVEWSPCQDSTNKNGGPWRRYYNPCGSLIGTLEVFRAYSEDQKITVYNCYATGKVNVPNICEDKRVYCHGALIGLVLDRYTVNSSNIKDTSKKDLTSWDDFKEYYIGHFGNNYNLENLRTYYEPINEYQGANILGLQKPKYNTLPHHEYVEIITSAQLKQQATFEGWDFTNIWKMGANGPVLR
ncbi:MAG: Ig-like domain-containing protein, partial [Clostridia bacterium]|nr:Ig-like domain-containing protein [Clostridia bacterium]